MILYTRITLIGFYFQLGFDTFRQYLNAMGLFMLHFWTAFSGLVINVIMCYWLIQKE